MMFSVSIVYSNCQWLVRMKIVVKLSYVFIYTSRQNLAKCLWYSLKQDTNIVQFYVYQAHTVEKELKYNYIIHL